MKRYALLVKRFLGARPLSRKRPSKQLHKSKIIGLAISAMSLLALGTGAAVVNAVVNTGKTGTDTTTNSTTQTQPNHTVKWVMSYGHSGSLGTVALTDPIPAGTQFVAGSLIAPPGYNKSYSQNGGTSYGSVDPGTATTNLKVEGDAPATQTAVTSGLAQPPQSFNGAQGGGDGYEAFFDDQNNLWNFNHHTTASGLNNSNIQCHNKNTGANCAGFPKYANSVAGTPLGTGATDIGFPATNQGGQLLDTTNNVNKIFLPANKTDGSGNGGPAQSFGVLCADLVTQQSCGYTPLVNSSDPTESLAGGALIDDKFYTMQADGDIYCVVIPGNTPCAGYPKPSYAGVTTTGSGACNSADSCQAHIESFDDTHIFTTSYDGTDHYIGCFDVSTGAICAGWNPTKSYVYSTPYGLIMAPIKNASGTQTGICIRAHSTPGTSGYTCYNMNGTPTGVDAPWGQQVAGQFVGWPNGGAGNDGGFGSILSIGTKLYQPYVSGDAATYTCWDFATNANCTDFAQNTTNAGLKPYTLRQDPFNPGCIWETGDAGIFEVFDADTGSFSCSRSAAEVSAAPSSFYCDGQPGHVQGWTNVKINNITGSQYASGKITIRGVDGNPLPGYNNRDLTLTEKNSGIIDISALPVGGNTATLTAQITLYSPDGTPWTTNSPPYLQLTWDGDDIQFCFETTVTPCSQLTAITNTATFLTADDEAPAGQTDTATATLQSPDSTCAADVHTKKTVDKTTYNPGDTLTYSIQVTNNGPVAATNVTVTDDLAQILDDATYNNDAVVSGAGGGSVAFSGTTLTYQNASLGAGQSSTITFTVTTANPGTGNKSLPNKAVANTGNCVEGSTDPDCSTLTQGPNVTVVKTVDKTTYNPGDTLNYTISITNNGAAPANITVDDDLTQLLDDATYNNNAAVTSGTGTVSYTSPTLHYANPALGAGQSATVTFSVTTQSPGTGDKSLPNKVISNIGNCQTGSTDPQCSVITQGPNVDIVKAVDKTTFNPGDTLNYTITVKNNGAAPANVNWTDNLSGILDDATYNNDASVAGSGATSYAQPTLTYTNASLGAGQTATITFSVTTTNPGTGDKSLPNKVVSNIGNCVQGSTDPKCNTLSSGPNVRVTKTVDKTTFNPGDTLNYTITVQNTGAAAANASWTDDLSQILDDATYNNDAATTGGAVAYSTPNLTYQNANLGAGQTDTITFSVTTVNPGTGDKDLPNKVVSNIGNCVQGSTDPACVTGSQGPDIEVNKVADKTTFNPGDTVNYTVTVKNQGAGPANVNVTDDMSGVLDDATYNNNAVVTGGGTVSFASPNLTYTNASLGAGQTATITFSVTTNNPGSGDKKLTNRVVSNLGNCVQGSTDPACVFVTDGPSVTFKKTVDKGTAVPGDTITYTITATNTGSAPANNISYVDNLSGILDDATYNGDAIASNGGTVSYAGTTLTYTNASLGAGQTSTVTFTATLKKPATGDKNLVNRIVSNTANCQTGSTDPQCVATTFISDIHINKNVDKTTFNPGNTVTYTATVKNDGTGAATNVTLTDDLSGVLDDASYNNDAVVSGGDGTVSVSGNTLTYTDSSLDAGQTVTITYSVTTTNPGTGDKDLHNKLQSNYGNCQTGSTDPACETHSLGPNVVFDKAVSSNITNPGDTLTYTITGTNNGKAPATNVVVTDDLTPLLDDAAYNNDAVVSGPGTIAYASPTLTYQTPTLNVGDNVTITFTVTLKKPATGDKTLKNQLVSNQGNCQQNSTDPKCVKTTNEANVVSRKSADKTKVLLGDTVTYTWIVENNGTAAASNVTVIDNMSKLLDDAAYNNDAVITSGPGTISYAEPEITYTSPTLAAGQTTTITYSVKVTNPQNGDLSLDNEIKGYDCTPTSICKHEILVTPPTNLDVKKSTAKPSAYEDKNLEYTVTYTNLPTEKNPEPSDAHGVIVTETVPKHTTFVKSESDPLWVCDSATPVKCSAEVGTVEASKTGTLKFVVKVDKGFTEKVDAIHNEVKIEDDCASSCPPGPRLFNHDTPIGKIEMQKTAPTNPIAPGQKLTYTITAKNVGTGPVTNYTITDDLRDVLDDATYNNDPVSNVGATHYTEPTLTWIGDIQAGQTMTLTYSITVKKAGSGNGKIINSVIDPEAISNCMPGSTDPKCTATVGVSLAKTGENTLWISTVATGVVAAGALAWIVRRRLVRG